jgi:uncharacterized protein
VSVSCSRLTKDQCSEFTNRGPLRLVRGPLPPYEYKGWEQRTLPRDSLMRVFVTGGTGLIGSRLISRLMQRGDWVVLLTRRFAAARQMFGTNCEVVEGDPMQPGDWQDRAAGCEGVIHLAGENIFNRRWSAAFKTLMYDSRVKTTQNVVDALKRQPKQADGSPKILVNASAIGYYGPHADEELTEESPPGGDYLAKLCVDWEKAALAAQRAGIRVAMVRVGIVLDQQGGALGKMLTPFKMGVGGPIGNGRQWMSWIHQDDMIGLFLLALDNAQANGPLNGVASHPVTNRDFGKALGRALHRPSFMPTPVFALRVLLGEVANVVAKGQRVLPRVPLQLGYQYRFPTIDAALAEILK